MAKIKKLVLSYPNIIPGAEDRPYKVVRVQHTTEFDPGDMLSRKQVDELHDSKCWDVSTVAEKT